MTQWLSRDAVAELTGTAPISFKAQRRRLQIMGIPFTPSFTGRPLVDPDAVAHNQGVVGSSPTSGALSGVYASI